MVYSSRSSYELSRRVRSTWDGSNFWAIFWTIFLEERNFPKSGKVETTSNAGNFCVSLFCRDFKTKKTTTCWAPHVNPMSSKFFLIPLKEVTDGNTVVQKSHYCLFGSPKDSRHKYSSGNELLQVTKAIRQNRKESIAMRRESRATRIVAAILSKLLRFFKVSKFSREINDKNHVYICNKNRIMPH